MNDAINTQMALGKKRAPTPVNINRGMAFPKVSHKGGMTTLNGTRGQGRDLHLTNPKSRFPPAVGRVK